MRPSEAKETLGIHGVNICRTRREKVGIIVKGGFFGVFFMYDIQHCFICRSSDSTVSEDAEIAPRTVATIRHWLSDALTAGLDLIRNFFHYFIQHRFICRPSESTVSKDAGIEPRTVATTA
jgi:hypothetical protein